MTNKPRTVTAEQIQANIASERLFTAVDGLNGAGELASNVERDQLALLTFCVLVLKNGHKVVGINHGALDPSVHSAEMGRELAREDAVDKVRDLLAFRLRDQIAAEAPVQLKYKFGDIVRHEVDQDRLTGDLRLWALMSDGKKFTATVEYRIGEGQLEAKTRSMTELLRVANEA